MAGNAISFTQARTDDTAQRLLFKIAISLGALNPRLDDTAQRLTWKIVGMIFSAGSNPRFAPRLDDTWQRLLWKWASLLFVSHGGSAGQQPRLDDTAQRLLVKIAGLLGLPCSCSPSEAQRLLYDIATALQPTPAPGPGPSPTPCALPLAPVDLGASAGDGYVYLLWPFGVGATGYNVKRSLVSGGPYTIIGTVIANPFVAYTDFTAVNGTTYYYVMSSTNACGESINDTVESHATPLASFSYTPATAVINWIDSGGVHNGDLAVFNADPDRLTTTSITATSLGITAVTGLQSLTALNSLVCSTNALTTIDVSACLALNHLDCSTNDLTVLAVNTLLNSLVTNGQIGGSCNCASQAPAASPSVGPPNGIVAKAALLLAGWTVTTD